MPDIYTPEAVELPWQGDIYCILSIYYFSILIIIFYLYKGYKHHPCLIYDTAY